MLELKNYKTVVTARITKFISREHAEDANKASLSDIARQISNINVPGLIETVILSFETREVDDKKDGFYNFIDFRWFSSKDLIGAVAIKNIDTTGEYWRCFIGVGRGLDEKDDKESIAAHGTSLPEDLAKMFFPKIELRYKT